MATITASKITESGTTASPTTVTQGGDQFENTGVEFIRVINYHRTKTYSVKVEVQTTSVRHPQYGDLTKSHIFKAISSPGSGASANVGSVDAYFGPFKQAAFNDGSNMVKVYYKDGTGTSETAWNALSAIPSSNSLLKIEVLYLDN